MYQNIEAERARYKMTQQELANALGVSLRTVQYWLRGKKDIPSSALIQMAKMWGKSIDYLLGLKDDAA